MRLQEKSKIDHPLGVEGLTKNLPVFLFLPCATALNNLVECEASASSVRVAQFIPNDMFK